MDVSKQKHQFSMSHSNHFVHLQTQLVDSFSIDVIDEMFKVNRRRKRRNERNIKKRLKILLHKQR